MSSESTRTERWRARFGDNQRARDPTPGGAFTTSQSHCVNPQGPTPLAFTDGHFTFTFNGGSTLSGTYGGVLAPTPTPNVFTIDGDAVFTSGTGEFAGARGTAEATGTLNIQTGAASVGTLTGTITR